jgi:CheY-like chemotaxis protein
MQNSRNPILLVEDSPEDTEAMMRAFKKAGLANPIYHCIDGDDALDYLHQRGRYAEIGSAPRPSVILLDLNMPGTDGREVLAEIKKDKRLQKTPVVVLTTSTDERDIEKCYQMGANSYIMKPVDLDGFMRAIQLLKNYWFEIVILPKQDTPG